MCPPLLKYIYNLFRKSLCLFNLLWTETSLDKSQSQSQINWTKSFGAIGPPLDQLRHISPLRTI